ncbi:MAG: RdgB/HAM1 family non-canonical purine NTP pyrophosphatase [Ignavibacteriales bacterium]|nr:RdgB/HAM1 family non-canonical purine NTP pyrophosphatase [Ignavibacteriales bacterium]
MLFASKNKGKIHEVQNLFAPIGITILGLYDVEEIADIEETGSTFEENAFIKAAEVRKITGLPVMGDDSGLVVEQLNGAPGIHSARFSGLDATEALNNSKLLNALSGFPEPHKAKYVCAAVYLDAGHSLCTIGEVHGKIVNTAKGTGGFGYDPYFIPDGYQITMAELPLSEKNIISHRGIAFRELYEKIKQLY